MRASVRSQRLLDFALSQRGVEQGQNAWRSGGALRCPTPRPLPQAGGGGKGAHLLRPCRLREGSGVGMSGGMTDDRDSRSLASSIAQERAR